ncbi:MAG TPA: aminoglycoside phosphotransferase family protein, partial [Chitinophagaceae bacterium]|nr:aminoglycoside phosphotransferase family protein [Chitinophagaceae bacterium]
MEKLHNILLAYGLLDESSGIEDFGTGLINHTWKIKSGGGAFILQKLNSTVFKEPADIAHNIRLVADHLEKHHPEYHFVAPIRTLKGEEMVY